MFLSMIGKYYDFFSFVKRVTNRQTKMPADNKRFGASGGVTSNDLLWGI